jgi:hypothetical protein
MSMITLPSLFSPKPEDGDPEVNAMGACIKAIGPLNDAARLRVIRWLMERQQTTPMLQPYKFED